RRQRRLLLCRDAAKRWDDDVDVARALPAGIRRSGGIGTDRRSEHRLEGSRLLVELFDVHTVASGRRQGCTAEGCEVPGPTGSAREIATPNGWDVEGSAVSRRPHEVRRVQLVAVTKQKGPRLAHPGAVCRKERQQSRGVDDDHGDSRSSRITTAAEGFRFTRGRPWSPANISSSLGSTA